TRRPARRCLAGGTPASGVGPDSPARHLRAGRTASLKQPSWRSMASHALKRRNAAHGAEHPARPGSPESCACKVMLLYPTPTPPASGSTKALRSHRPAWRTTTIAKAMKVIGQTTDGAQGKSPPLGDGWAPGRRAYALQGAGDERCGAGLLGARGEGRGFGQS